MERDFSTASGTTHPRVRADRTIGSLLCPFLRQVDRLPRMMRRIPSVAVPTEIARDRLSHPRVRFDPRNRAAEGLVEAARCMVIGILNHSDHLTHTTPAVLGDPPAHRSVIHGLFRKIARGIGYGALRAFCCRCILSIIATTASIKPANKMIASLSQFLRGTLC